MPRHRFPRTPTFDEWKAAVNAALLRTIDCEADDLPDYDYAAAYEDGRTPSATARRAIAYARTF